jgi:cytidylate kinase
LLLVNSSNWTASTKAQFAFKLWKATLIVNVGTYVSVPHHHSRNSNIMSAKDARLEANNEETARSIPSKSELSSSKSSHRAPRINNGRIIILSGPIGAGKSTVAEALVASSNTPIVYIEGDTFWHFIKNRGKEPITSISRAGAGRIIMKSMMLAALPYARGGFETIVDFTIGPWFLGLFKAWIKDTLVDYIILCPSEEVCAERTALRDEGAKHDHELYDAFNNLGDFEKYAIRKDEASPAELAAQIREGISGGMYKLDFTNIKDSN